MLGMQHSYGHRGTQLTRYAYDTGRPPAGALTEDAPAAYRTWLDRRHLMAAYAAFGAYAVAAAFLTGGRDRVWAIWAACGYAVALAVLAPLLWLSVGYPLEDGIVVIDRSASLLLHHGSPYLAADQVTSWLSYNPYLPVMTLFGLPSAVGIGGLAGNSGMWIAIGTVIPLAAAFWIAMRPRRYDALLATAVAVASPVVGLNLAVITTDPPVLALILLALALATRPPRPGRTPWITPVTGSGVALGVACDLKSTAWLAVPVLAAMVAARDGARAAGRFLAAVAGTAAVLAAALAPAALTSWRGADALVQNSVLFP